MCHKRIGTSVIAIHNPRCVVSLPVPYAVSSLSAGDAFWADLALLIGRRRAVAKSHTTNVASSSSRGVDRLVAVVLLLLKSSLLHTASWWACEK